MLCRVALLDRDAADEHRLEPRHGCDGARCVPTWNLDLPHRRRLLLGRILVRDGPARRARDEAEVRLVVDAVDLCTTTPSMSYASFARRAPILR